MKNTMRKKWGNTRRTIPCINIILVFLLFLSMPLTASTIAPMAPREDHASVESRLQGGWEIQQSGTTNTLQGVSFTDADTGTAVGESTTILRTTDGGTSWSPQSCSLTIDLFDVSFSDATTGVACGTLGSIIYTTTAGNTWITYQTGWMMQYYAAHMETSLIGILVGESSIFSPLVTWTLNGWQTHTTEGFLLNNNEGQLWDIHYSSPTTWLVAANVWNGEGAIARTVDGGTNWATIYWTDRGFFGMDFPSDTIGYAVGRAGIIVKTTDGGNTWNHLSSGVSTTLLDVSFASETCGTAVGQNGVILRTEDGGSTWVPQQSGTPFDLYAVQLIDSNIGFAVGENGVILHTSTGGYPEDVEPPVTTCNLNGTLSGDIFISDVTVTFTAIDTGSGVNYTMYQLDDGAWSLYTKPFVVSTDGEHTLDFFSVDIAGNKETKKHYNFTIQHPEPSITIRIKGGIGISLTITNTGSTALTNVNWTIRLDGGLMVIGKTKSGTIATLPAGDSASVQHYVLGVGKTDITVEAAGVVETAKATVLFFLVFGVK